MTKVEDFKLLKIQTFVLKVSIHCDGCKQKVKKLLQRIEGVYTVNIDADQQKVTVSGNVDSATLIKKLVRTGKHAELWSQKSSQNQNQKPNCFKDVKNNKVQNQGPIKGLEAFRNQQKFPTFCPGEEEDYSDDDEEYDDEEELRFLRERANQLGLLRQQAIDANNAKKGLGAIPAGPNIIDKLNSGKKGNPSQNMGIKVNPGGIGIDQKTMAALKMNNAHLVGGNPNPGEVKRGNDMNSMMSLSSFPGNGALGSNSNALGGFQFQPNSGFQSCPAGLTPNRGFATGHHPSSMMMNMNGMQGRQALQQPQMLYERSPFVPPTTGYYYNYLPAIPQTYSDPNCINSGDSSAADMFSDDNTSSCSIM
ncbi:heavy metal-associated isoprenylated plant protein 37 [Malania oleifera]|uniref:heavy metal-associated isoprenylated plant protein 37 n=1 Tax=Malania oleifera TaxID=397392 RepID=UPI0025ADFF2E|nr:heavy metal-associated isoprenylated plant protein 37 [Malania oleifera]